MSGISDQFEVEPYVSYSGSYADTVMFGEMFVSSETLRLGYTPLGISGSFNSRRLVSSRFVHSATSYMNDAWMPGWLVNGYVTGSFLGRPQRVQRFFSESEYFFDSFIPNPVEIHLRSSASLLGFGLVGTGTDIETSGAFYRINPVDQPNVRAGTLGIALRFLTYPAVSSSIMPEVTSSWVDRKWGPAFPMESRYKNVERIFFFDGVFPQNYAISNFEVILGDTLPVTPASSSNYLAEVSWIVSGSRGGDGKVGVFGFLKRPTERWPMTLGNLRAGTIPTRESMNGYFGFGKGVGNTYSGGAYSSGQEFRRTIGIHSVFGGNNFSDDRYFLSVFCQPRGYRYGLKAPEPEHSSCVWRIGRFGQLRDMLEQRPFSKMKDVVNGAIGTEGPVRFSFLTGSTIYSQSLDYVTATNPSYNSHDSGEWDVEYKSGQPFADRDATD